MESSNVFQWLSLVGSLFPFLFITAGWWVAAVCLRKHWILYALAIVHTFTTLGYVALRGLWFWNASSGGYNRSVAFWLSNFQWLTSYLSAGLFLIFVYWLIGRGDGCLKLLANDRPGKEPLSLAAFSGIVGGSVFAIFLLVAGSLVFLSLAVAGFRFPG
jgi:hypothetical protein